MLSESESFFSAICSESGMMVRVLVKCSATSGGTSLLYIDFGEDVGKASRFALAHVIIGGR